MQTTIRYLDNNNNNNLIFVFLKERDNNHSTFSLMLIVIILNNVHMFNDITNEFTDCKKIELFLKLAQ